MRKIFLVSALCAMIGSSAMAQDAAKKEHSIKVIGTAELEIVPDEIYVSVTLREYMKDKKKLSIEELEKNFVNFVEKTTATEKKDIKMNNLDACMISMKRKKNKDEVITKNYTVKYKNAQQVYQLFSVMDSLGITAAYVSKYSHSKMDEYKKQIKTEAIKAARIKADYLTAAIGEKAGKALSIVENSGFVSVDDGVYRNRYENYAGNVSNSYAQTSYALDGIGAGPEEDAVSDKTIKLHYEINAEFEIQ